MMTVNPAEEIVPVRMPNVSNVSADGLVTEEALLQAGAEAALVQDGRFRADGGLVVFHAELAPELQDELDHLCDREQRLAKLGAL